MDSERIPLLSQSLRHRVVRGKHGATERHVTSAHEEVPAAVLHSPRFTNSSDGKVPRRRADAIPRADGTVGSERRLKPKSPTRRNDAQHRKTRSVVGATTPTSVSPPMIAFQLKIIVVGEFGTGKTSIVKRYADNQFKNATYTPTVGMDFTTKTVYIYPNVIARVHIWDLAGQERFHSITKSVYRDIDAAIVVCDVENSRSVMQIPRWKQRIEENYAHKERTIEGELRRQLDHECYATSGITLPPSNSKHIVCALSANKIDLQYNRTLMDLAVEMADTHNFDMFFSTSAKRNTHVSDLFNRVVRESVEKKIAMLQRNGINVMQYVANPTRNYITGKEYGAGNSTREYITIEGVLKSWISTLNASISGNDAQQDVYNYDEVVKISQSGRTREKEASKICPAMCVLQ